MSPINLINGGERGILTLNLNDHTYYLWARNHYDQICHLCRSDSEQTCHLLTNKTYRLETNRGKAGQIVTNKTYRLPGFI